MNQVGNFSNLVKSYLMNHLDNHYEIYTLNAEFNKECFATYWKQILQSQDIYCFMIICSLWLLDPFLL